MIWRPIPFRNTYIYVIAVALLLLAACSGNKNTELILSQPEMVPILKEMQVGHAGVDLAATSANERQKLYGEMNTAILNKLGVDEALFYRSYAHYQENPVLMDTLLSQVIIALNADLDSSRKAPAKPLQLPNPLKR